MNQDIFNKDLAEIFNFVSDVAIAMRARALKRNFNQHKEDLEVLMLMADSIHNINMISSAIQIGNREHLLHAVSFHKTVFNSERMQNIFSPLPYVKLNVFLNTLESIEAKAKAS